MFNDTEAVILTTDAIARTTPTTVASAVILATAAFYAHTFIQIPDRKVNDQTSCLGLVATVIGRDFAALQILIELYGLVAPSFALPQLPSTHSSHHLSPRAALGALTLISGGALRTYAHSAMGKNYLFDLRVGQSHSLVTSGPYALVRHPMYLGLGLVYVGWILLLAPGNGGAFARAWPMLAFVCWLVTAVEYCISLSYYR